MYALRARTMMPSHTATVASVANEAQAIRSGRSTWNAQSRKSHRKLASAPAARSTNVSMNGLA